jgi:para-nitrobenzyl esterase
MRTIACLTAITALTLATACTPEATAPTPTASGEVQGLVEDGVAFYRNIPYAAAPVGELRWRAPQPHPGWSETRNATEYGPTCWQATEGDGNSLFMERLFSGSGMGGFSQWLLTTAAGMTTPNVGEDCLSLNITAPLAAQGLPVMFWIHGGGHQFGSGGGPYDSPSLAKHGVVLVSINYRLGIYGFMAHPELAAEDPNGSTGNYGTLDQIAALQWVRDNIANFGGDPTNVTIFGESAGGHSVGQLVASPVARGLFHKAIAQSGTGFQQFQATNAEHERMSGYAAGREVARLAGVAGQSEIARLRELPVEALAAIATRPELSDTFHPQIDGYVLPTSTAQIFQTGQQARIPLIIGSNADEGSVLYYLGVPPVDGGPLEQPTTVAEWDRLLRNQFGDKAKILDAEYAVDQDRDVVKAAERLMGDSLFGRHAFYMAQKHAARGLNAYLYFYERRPPAQDQTIGASHALELNHVFGGFLPMWPSDARDEELTEQMQTYWTTFAATGNPNSVGQPQWTKFKDLDAQEMAFGHEATGTRRVAREARYRAMRAQFEKRRLAASGGSLAGGGGR